MPSRFHPTLTRFHVFARRLAVFRRFRCNTVQRTRPLQVIRRLRPSLSRFHVFASRLAVFRRFRCNTVQRTRPRQVIRHLPVFARRLAVFASRLAVFASSLAFFRRFCCTRCYVRVRVKLSDACLFSPVA